MVSKKKPVGFTGLYPPSKEFNTPVTQQKDFSQSWVEFAAQNFEEVLQDIEGASPFRLTLYTVPANKLFFMTSCWGNVDNGASAGNVLLERLADFHKIFNISNSASHTASISMNFPMPLRFPAGTILAISGTGNGKAGITGFLVSFVI